MRRTIAILVVLAIMGGVSAPAIWAAQLDGNTHACCRRDGAHHCSSASVATGHGFGSAHADCPVRSCQASVPGPSVSVLTGLISLHAPATVPFIVRSTSPEKASYDYRASVPSRGPPLS